MVFINRHLRELRCLPQQSKCIYNVDANFTTVNACHLFIKTECVADVLNS